MDGTMITGYKKGANNTLIILDIPSDSLYNMNRSDIVNKQFAKYRCSYAIVKEIIDLKSGEKMNETQSMNDKNFKYSVGQKVVPNTFDTNLENICSSGIHFFLDKECAELYEHFPTNGEYKNWYDNGQLLKHCFYKNGKLDGEYKIWYDNEQLSRHCFYKNGKIDGEFKEWHSNGKLSTYYFYKNGELDGELKEWYDNGQLCILCFYKNGKYDGELKEWYPNGQLYIHCFYNDGNLIES
jgi:antitoxin component YwqK of YwqJK toxin-antitoxin module